MRKAFVVGVLCLCCFAGCGCSLNQQFVSAVDAAWQEIGPEYIQYVNDDPNLNDDQKENRKRTAVILTRVIDNAMAEETEEAKDE